MRKDKPSRTAYKVALNIITLGTKPGMDKVFPPGIVEATAKLLVESGLVSATVVRWYRSQKMVSIYESFDWMMPGQFEAFAHRKAFCERQVREGICNGTTQVLILGAGYDTMGWRLALEFPDVGFFEIDHPATAHFKEKGVEAMGTRDNLHLIAVDLSERRLADVLTANKSWDGAAQTVVLAEGLLMYLPDAAVRDLLGQCVAMTGAESRIAFTYVGTMADGRPDAGPWTSLLLWTLKVNGEPWLWSIRPDQLSRFLEETGWRSAPDLLGTTNKHGVEFFGVAVK
jgi:methyltransferase (TIGR00027 family)